MGEVFDCYNLARSASTGKNLGKPLLTQEGEPLMLLLCAVKQDEATKLSSAELEPTSVLWRTTVECC